jgi:hypothetical protein
VKECPPNLSDTYPFLGAALDSQLARYKGRLVKTSPCAPSPSLEQNEIVRTANRSIPAPY